MAILYDRIQYKKCKVFDDGKGGRLIQETDTNGKIVYCCGGAYEGGEGWESICDECFDCSKYIRKVIGEI